MWTTALRRLLCALTLACVVFLAAPQPANAAGDEVRHLDTTYTIGPDGRVQVRQQLVWVFGQAGRRGIQLDIATQEQWNPAQDVAYFVSDVEVESPSGAPPRCRPAGATRDGVRGRRRRRDRLLRPGLAAAAAHRGARPALRGHTPGDRATHHRIAAGGEPDAVSLMVEATGAHAQATMTDERFGVRTLSPNVTIDPVVAFAMLIVFWLALRATLLDGFMEPLPYWAALGVMAGVGAALVWTSIRGRIVAHTRTATATALRDQVLGFRRYLATAEADQLDFEADADIMTDRTSSSGSGSGSGRSFSGGGSGSSSGFSSSSGGSGGGGTRASSW